MKTIFDDDGLRVELADRMGIDAEGFNPMYNPSDDYKVLQWMRTEVKNKYFDTYRTFISYISGAMHQYVVGDFARGAICAAGIVDPRKPTTGNE